MSPVRLDASAPDWRLSALGLPSTFAAMFCANVIHIAPWAVAEGLLAGAGRHLAAGGRLFLYGPFKRDGQHNAPSNAAFDASLRSQNPDWGVRDTADLRALAATNGLRFVELVEMPSNNADSDVRTLAPVIPGRAQRVRPSRAGPMGASPESRNQIRECNWIPGPALRAVPE